MDVYDHTEEDDPGADPEVWCFIWVFVGIIGLIIQYVIK